MSLTSISSSLGYILDSSPPRGGIVYDGPQPQQGNLDLDYTSVSTSLSAHWGGTLDDPHTGIAEYYWAIGSCPGCYELQGWNSVGIATGKITPICLEIYSFECSCSLQMLQEVVSVCPMATPTLSQCEPAILSTSVQTLHPMGSQSTSPLPLLGRLLVITVVTMYNFIHQGN